jgi:uncharacterized protein
MDRLRYHSLNTFFRNTFGRKVFKISLAGGFTCPVRDGTLGFEGCVFCNPCASVPKHYEPGMPIGEQIKRAMDYARKRHGAQAGMAYFQDYTATYGTTEELRRLYRETLGTGDIVGLALCTRPDCINEPVLDLLEEISRETFLWVELGVQSGCDVTLLRMKRRHTVHDSEKAFEALHSRGIRTSAHIMLGFPGESREEALSTSSLIRRSGTSGVKIQNLLVLKDTELARIYSRGGFSVMKRSVYAEMAATFLERIPPDVVIQRLTGESPRGMLVAPLWSINKLSVIDRIHRELLYRDSWQGKELGYPLHTIPVPGNSASSADRATTL